MDELPPDLPSLASLRGAWLEVDLTAFRRNVAALRGWLAPHVHLMAVLKADGYGAGALPLARVAVEAGADRLAVATVAEGIRLRQAGIRHPILLLSLIPVDAVATALLNDLELTVSDVSTLRLVATIARDLGVRACVHLKVDTGMARVGADANEVGALLGVAQSEDSLELVGVSSHFASADDLDGATLARAHDKFRQVVVQHAWPAGVLRHVANSAATLRSVATHWDLVRPGLILHGVIPGPWLPPDLRLSPILTLRARLMQVREFPPGTVVGYGGRHRVARRTRLGILPVGYADGLPRAVEGKARVLVAGVACPVVGAVSMDQVVVDLGPGSPEALPVGTMAVLMGRQGEDVITADELASWAGTLPYEILTGLGRRLPRVYLGS
ncbi:MAG: alanine racemase [Candidatus Sericytochromatia bacterium]|nr:alanine racemase [Candidatus Sericytochromatia bacterium]